tara:strand:+ start:1155 stop:1541 length:387 start_codon:yes stop_codon:yes gene_type:complete
MAGKIIADQLQSTTAGTIDTKFVVNGSAKTWMHLNGTGTIAIQDSFNTSSVTDVGAGSYTQTYTNGMNNAFYGSQLSYNRSTSTNNGCMGFIDSTYTSALLNILLVRHDNLANEDSSRVMTTLHGDLA